MNPSKLAPFLILPVLLTSALLAQALRGPVLKPQTLDLDERWFDTSRIVLKLAEESGVRLRGGRFQAMSDLPEPQMAEDLKAINMLLPGPNKVQRLFERSEKDLDQERARILATLPKGWDRPVDLNLYYCLVEATPAAGKELCRKLNELGLVETAFPDHRPGIEADPGDIPPTTPHYRSQQGYLDAPPAGIHIAVAHQIPGGRGEQLQILDIETGLILDHEDVPAAIQKNVIGALPSARDHGLAVAGEMVAERNAYGVTGGAWKAGYKFHSHQSVNWASSVSVATQNSKPGDIIVLEVHLVHPVSRRYTPMENRQDVFDAVRTATLQGIHVVAAAGNGSSDLDSSVYAGIFDRKVRDSGSVIVGATNGVQLARASFSNYGTIVDANGWGYNVVSTGYGSLFYPNSDPKQKYTSTFSGTSSATPIVTSAVAALLSSAKQQLAMVLKPTELRGLLRLHGTAVPNAMIGVRPDLEKLLAAVGLPDGLTLVNPARLGAQVALEVSGKAGDKFMLFVSDAPADVVLPWGRILIDPSVMILASAGTLDSQGKHGFSVLVPAAVAFLHREFHWQALRHGSSALNLTSSVVTFVDG